MMGLIIAILLLVNIVVITLSLYESYKYFKNRDKDKKKMTIESQLERICVALEALAKMHAGPTFNQEVAVAKITDTPKPEVKEVVAKKTEPKVEAKKEEPKDEAVPEVTNKTSFEDLADKVKALGRTNRDAVVALFKQFGIERLGGLEEKDYIAFDIAIAKALTATKGT